MVTQPERPGSRGRPAPRPVGEAAAELGLPVLRPERIRTAESVAEILSLAPDALVVAAYGQIIPVALLDAPAHGGVNVHASLLPRWRGAAPVAAAILAGDETTGVSIMRMDAGLDTGPVYAHRDVSIGAADTTPSLTERLAAVGAGLLLEVLTGLEDGLHRGCAAGRLERPRTRRGCAAKTEAWSGTRSTATDLDRRVRALEPWPGVTAPLGGQPVRILEGTPGPRAATAAPGTVVAVDGEAADVATASGVYRVAAVHPPGGRPMSAAAYLRGRRRVATPP